MQLTLTFQCILGP